MTAPRKIAIVGGGMLGLTLALRLNEMGHKVTVFEAAPVFGGLASAWNIGSVTWDKHYHVTLYSDLNTRQVLGEIGLENELVWASTKTGCYSHGKLYSVSNAAEFLKFPHLTIIEKFRLALTILRASRLKNWRALEQETVETWLRRWSGNGAYETFWRPLLISKLGEAHERTSAAFIWATIQRLYATRRNGLGEERFGFVRGGYARVFSRFAEVLTDKGVELVSNARISEIRTSSDGMEIQHANGDQARFDSVVVTTAPAIAAKLCPTIDERERKRLSGFEYLGIVCPSVLLSRPLGGCYVTNIVDDGFPFTGVIEMSSLVPVEQTGGHYLVYLPRYHVQQDGIAALADDEIQTLFLTALRKMYPDLTDEDVLSFQVSRVRNVMPIPTINYSQTVLPFNTSKPGLYLVNSSQIVNGTLNVNETIGLANRAISEGVAA
ncbi:MAG: NAD(P)/FAD-dependent oxidoreductase [Ruegeria sp.]